MLPQAEDHDQNTKNTKSKPCLSIVCNWFIIICLFVGGGMLELPTLEPNHQCIPGYTQDSFGNYLCGNIKNPELSYPYKQNTISAQMLFILAFAPWIFTLITNILILCCVDSTYRLKAILKNIGILLQMLLFSFCATNAMSSVIKFSVGRPRPNFYALMEDGRSVMEQKQARKSFPSGHASMSMSCLYLLTLNLYSSMNYVQIRFRKQNKNILEISMNNIHSYFYLQIWWILRNYLLFSILLVFVPTFLAIYIACTRVTDYWHHYIDIAVGVLLGAAGATISFMIYKHEFYSFNVNDQQQLQHSIELNADSLVEMFDDDKRSIIEQNN